ENTTTGDGIFDEEGAPEIPDDLDPEDLIYLDYYGITLVPGGSLDHVAQFFYDDRRLKDFPGATFDDDLNGWIFTLGQKRALVDLLPFEGYGGLRRDNSTGSRYGGSHRHNGWRGQVRVRFKNLPQYIDARNNEVWPYIVGQRIPFSFYPFHFKMSGADIEAIKGDETKLRSIMCPSLYRVIVRRGDEQIYEDYTKKRKTKRNFKKKNPELTIEKKNQMKDECCLATLSLLRKIGNVTGISEKPKFPGELPEKLTDPNTKDIIINNIADWHQYHFDMVDELVGQFPIDFKIEGEDACPDNIAEALAEIYGMTLDIKVDSYENKMAIARTLNENGLTRLAVNRILKNLLFVIDYLDPEREEVEEEIDMTFNPLAYEDKDQDGNVDEDSIEDFLQPSKQRIKYYIQFSGREKSLKEVISLLTEAAQITKSLHWHKMPRDPIAAKSYLRDLINLGTDVAADFVQYRGGKDNSWEDFTENIEENWRDKTGAITDDKSDNPRIKEFK
ncbi:MAG: hypothetical protein AAF705_09365, partial [Bacteroidota bacterium]